MNSERITIGMKKIGKQWHGALIVDDIFQKAMIEDLLEQVLLKSLVLGERPEGTNVTVNVTIQVPVAKEVAASGPDSPK